MGKFAVPRQYQQNALMIGIILALVMRGIFIAVGAAAINEFSWVFYLFGLFLILTAVNLAREGAEEEQGYDEPRLVRWVRNHFPVSDEWNGVKFSIRENGTWLLTPMAMVVLTLGMTDLLFALDSIPAIYGLTSEPYLVLTANVFALMGLRQLYFLIGGLLQRLVYLSYGLAFLLAFIGVKLILHALHENELPFINGGEPVAWASRSPSGSPWWSSSARWWSPPLRACCPTGPSATRRPAELCAIPAASWSPASPDTSVRGWCLGSSPMVTGSGS